MKVHRNSEDGLQIEHDEVLLVLRPNDHHGLRGALYFKKENGDIEEIAFHGRTTDIHFPMAVHEGFLEKDVEGKDE